MTRKPKVGDINDCIHPTVASEIGGLVSELKGLISEIPNATITDTK